MNDLTIVANIEKEVRFEIDGGTAAEIKAIQEQGGSVIAHAREFAEAVVDAETAEAANSYLIQLKTDRKSAIRTPNLVRQKAHAHWQSTISIVDNIEAPYIEGETIISAKLKEYNNAEQEKYKKEQARLEAEQRKKADEARAAELEAAKKTGDVELIAQVEMAAPEPIFKPVIAAPPKLKGTSFRKKYKAIVEDHHKLKFIKAIAEGKIPVIAVELNNTFLNHQANAFKGELEKMYPGVTVIQEDVSVTRTV